MVAVYAAGCLANHTRNGVSRIRKTAAAYQYNRRGAFFFSAFSEAAAGGNAEVERRLAANGIGYSTGLPSSLSAGDVTFLPSADSDHDGFMTEAWVSEPLQWLLDRIPGYPR